MPDSFRDKDFINALTQAKTKRKKVVQVDGRPKEITVPYASPEDWRDQWIYFLLVDRFNNPDKLPRQQFDALVGDFQGGTFEGIRQQLGYLQELGVGAIWISPVLQNCQFLKDTFHGYGIQHFLRLDPRFASNKGNPDGELQALIDEAHARDIYVIFDIVLNHAGDVFAYILDNDQKVNTAPFRPTPYRINFRKADGTPNPNWENDPALDDPDLVPEAAVFPIELLHRGFFRRQGSGGEAGGDFGSLKEFITTIPDVRRNLILIYQHLIAKYDVDGLRIDTLKFIEPDFALTFGNAIREYALSIGKKNFFTFGEVFDNEEKISRFIGRRATDEGDLVGVDAALDFPLFFKLPPVAKGLHRGSPDKPLILPSQVVDVYQLRKRVEEGIISSHGEAGRFFVTFLDNHDIHERFYFQPRENNPDHFDPHHFDDQVSLGVACLFTLLGIPCLYYGTELGLHGAGDSDRAVREALWGRLGKLDAEKVFDRNHPFYRAIQAIAVVRQAQPALRYGRLYFRPLSGDKSNYGISTFEAGVLAFSRILNDEEVVVVANTNTVLPQSLFVIVDGALNADNPQYRVLFSNKATPAGPDRVEEQGNVFVREVDGSIGRGPLRIMRVTLQPMEVQILGK